MTFMQDKLQILNLLAHVDNVTMKKVTTDSIATRTIAVAQPASITNAIGTDDTAVKLNLLLTALRNIGIISR
jgi:hypothetical protein